MEVSESTFIEQVDNLFFSTGNYCTYQLTSRSARYDKDGENEFQITWNRPSQKWGLKYYPKRIQK